MPKSIDHIRVKIERAKEHIGDLNARIGIFNEAGPYSVIREEDAQTGDIVFYVRIKSDIPLSFAAIIGDAVQNLRSSLDHLAYQLVLANSGTPTKRTAFPIAESPEKYEALDPRKVEGMSETAVKKIHALHPYRGGNDAIWMLDELNNIDKHRLLLAVGSAHTDVVLDYRDMFPNVREPMLYSVQPSGASFLMRSFPLKDGAEIYRVLAAHREAYINQKPEFTFRITLGEPEIVKGEPIIPTLNQLASIVGKVVSMFEPLL
ncbi:MAG: hypothetical protein ACR2JB_10465 [Bryobacteraceae bacterium]